MEFWTAFLAGGLCGAAVAVAVLSVAAWAVGRRPAEPEPPPPWSADEYRRRGRDVTESLRPDPRRRTQWD